MVAIARVADGREDFEACGEAMGIVGFVEISGHPGTLKPQGTEYGSVRLLPVVASLKEGPWGAFTDPMHRPHSPTRRHTVRLCMRKREWTKEELSELPIEDLG